MSDGPNPSGLCMCGCSNPAPLAAASDKRWGLIKGQPLRYIRGHENRKSAVEYIEQDCGYDTPCWVWQLAIDKRLGYGVGPMVLGKRTTAHRAMYERLVGPIPEGLELDHLCHNRACVNPAHLEPVTHTENCHRGSRSKLTVDKVRDIRYRKARGERTSVLAEEFGVTAGHINQIARGMGWPNDELYREVALARKRGETR